MVPIIALLASNYKVKDFSIKTNKKNTHLSIFECDYVVSSLLVKFYKLIGPVSWASGASEKGGGVTRIEMLATPNVNGTKCEGRRSKVISRAFGGISS